MSGKEYWEDDRRESVETILRGMKSCFGTYDKNECARRFEVIQEWRQNND